MTYRLTITLFAPDTQGGHGLLLGLPHRLVFADQATLFRFADGVGIGPEVISLVERPLHDTLLVPTTRLGWTHTPSPRDPEDDQVAKAGRTYGTALRDYGLGRDCCTALRVLARTVPVAQPHAILQLRTEPT